ncbi:TonB-dependent receptor [Qipengyuania flava]|uniref:TonB-dependent receptor n=1 Tax=Qipengyuania flava TaxID=192812 RepID=UPI001C63AF6D|nr:TonB-dependent receptor [Qipengyuania flava]QYJ06256.1 TonB-dependent receptor [Qipengyuania flava]
MRRLIPLAALLGVLAAPLAAGDTSRAPSTEGNPDARSGEPIVVIGQDMRGSVDFDGPPLVEFDQAQIAAFAAADIAELLRLLDGEARSGSNGPLVLVNGKRVASLSSIDTFPAEALRRIEILPEEVAQRYGFAGDRKVLNLILRESFGALTTEGWLGASIEGGRGTYRADLGYSSIAGSQRWNISGRYTRRDSLTEAQRDLPGREAAFRTLLPASERVRLNLTWATETEGGTAFDLTTTLVQRDSAARSGRVGPPSNPRALERSARSRSVSLAGSASGVIGSWTWFARAGIDHFDDRSRFERVSGGRVVGERSRDETTLAEAEITLSGDVVELPAGGLYADVGLTASYERTAGSSSLAAGRLAESRRTFGGELGLSIPLLGGAVDPGLGALSGELRYGLSDPSDYAPVDILSAGFTWRPAQTLRLRALWSREESAPGVSDLAAPLTVTPNVRVYDFLTGQTVDADRLDGGNPALLPSVARRFTASLSISPLFVPDLRFEASYRRSRGRNASGNVSLASEEFAAAYPARFVRDANGQLLLIDARPVNFFRRDRDGLSWSLNFSRTYRPPSSGDEDIDAVTGKFRRGRGGGALLLGLSHTIALTDRLQAFRTSPVIDYLGGSAGANPRHRLSGDATWRRGGIGGTLEAQWESAVTVRDAVQSDGTRGPLRYPSLAKFNLKAFVDLGERLPPEPRYRWAEGLRVSLEVDNLFNTRRRVRDASGGTPRALLPAYLDPEGRAVRLRIRKLF